MRSRTPTLNDVPGSGRTVLTTRLAATGSRSAAGAAATEPSTSSTAVSRRRIPTLFCCLGPSDSTRPATYACLAVAMHAIRRERGRADCKVLGTIHVRGGVTDPLTGTGDHGLPGLHVERTATVRDPQHPPKDHGILVEFWPLSGLFPAPRAAHV